MSLPPCAQDSVPGEVACLLPGRELHPLEAPGFAWRTETTLDVSFNEPFGPVPCLMDFCQGRLASPVRSEPVTVLGKLWFIVCLQDGSYYILNHLWRPVWHAQWSFSTLRLVYIDTPCWRPLPPFVAQCFDHSVDLIE